MTGQTGSVQWVVITTDDLYSRLNAGQADALRDAALGSSTMTTAQSGDVQASGGVDSVFNAILPDVTARIRQYIGSNPRNRLSQTDNSVPPECKWMAVWLTLQDMIARLSIAIPLNDDQKRQITQANDDLKLIREIKPPWLAISNPVDPEPNPALTMGVYATVVSSSCREFSRHKLKQL